MIVVTGGAGFIGSAIVWGLNRQGVDEIVIVDNLNESEKWKNLRALKFRDYYDRNDFIEMIKKDSVPFTVSKIIHMGACSRTTETDTSYLMKNNFEYSKLLFEYAMKNRQRFIYASSGATYGDGEYGFGDDDTKLDELRPLNMYGYSKQLFDQYVKHRNGFKEVVGLKFFNVFGPNEYHKGSMTSKVFKSYNEILKTGKIQLFKSEEGSEYANGDSLRDFVYVKDVVYVILELANNYHVNGLFNVGTGRARSWNDLANAVFKSMGKEMGGENIIEYIDMPEELKGKYQYYTCAKNDKLNGAGHGRPVNYRSLEDAVDDYVKNYLIPGKYLGD
ncbi:MAG: ADP-glyceromanno-heptose 6-epimerase [Candidatus Delongbacteria bacterium]|nr:ADP-glyceromanno-heptose 6-epimerase [Candidatus Delongbacteria bacterium]MBN2834598.1 ADP-glyceromanno-heptose 6-epimerase [Candidatus Delongbacteria bacterium]